MTDQREATGPPSSMTSAPVTSAPMTSAPMTSAGLTRRGAIAGLCGVCVAAALVGCDDPDDNAGTQVTPDTTPTPETPTATADETPSAKPTKAANPKLLAKPSDIPVGGGVVFAAKNVVVTQPQEGTFKGFSATCTHQGAKLNAVSDGAIHCPRHGSAFSVKDGSVVNGPATAPLPKQELDVARNTISLP